MEINRRGLLAVGAATAALAAVPAVARDFSEPARIMAWDVADNGRRLTDRRAFVTLEKGFDDGIRADTDGNIRAATDFGCEGVDGIHVYAPQRHPPRPDPDTQVLRQPRLRRQAPEPAVHLRQPIRLHDLYGSPRRPHHLTRRTGGDPRPEPGRPGTIPVSLLDQGARGRSPRPRQRPDRSGTNAFRRPNALLPRRNRGKQKIQGRISLLGVLGEMCRGGRAGWPGQGPGRPGSSRAARALGLACVAQGSKGAGVHKTAEESSWRG